MAALALSLTRRDNGSGITITLHEPDTLIGRQADCHIQLEHALVSRQHAKISRRLDHYYLEDLGSSNGSLINGNVVKEPVILRHGDTLEIHTWRFQYVNLPATTDDPITVKPAESLLAPDRPALDGGRKLDAVLEISRRLASNLALEEHLPKVLDILLEIFPQAERTSIVLYEPTSGQLVTKFAKSRSADTAQTSAISQTIVNKVFQEKQPLLSINAADDDRFDTSQSIIALTIHSVMTVPLLGIDGDAFGVVTLDTGSPIHPFNDKDLQLLTAVAGQAALSYESARLWAAHLDQIKHQAQIDIAQRIQQALLPQSLPNVDGYTFAARYQAASAVGGDYYDMFSLPNGKICMAFGDVAGKGIPAALLMSRLSSVVQSTMQFVDNPQQAVGLINNHMCRENLEGRFVTLLFALLDPNSAELSLVNAGHMSPLIRRHNGKVEAFNHDSGGIPIGIQADNRYHVQRRPLAPGDTVVFYTDGITEAMNSDRALYGSTRLRASMQLCDGDAYQLGDRIMTDIQQHAGQVAQNDDISILILARDRNSP